MAGSAAAVTTTSSGSGLSTAAIVGIAVGGAVLLAAVGIGAWRPAGWWLVLLQGCGLARPAAARAGACCRVAPTTCQVQAELLLLLLPLLPPAAALPTPAALTFPTACCPPAYPQR